MTDNDVTEPLIITALGIRTIPITDLPQRAILLTRYQLLLVDPSLSREEWEIVLDDVLSVTSGQEGH